MKKMNWMIMIVLTSVLALAGCSKASKAPAAPEYNGVKVDMPKLQQEFATAKPELQQLLGQAMFGLRYSDYKSAVAALDKLAASPDLTESQKKAVAEVTEQVKQAASKAPAPAGQ